LADYPGFLIVFTFLVVLEPVSLWQRYILLADHRPEEEEEEEEVRGMNVGALGFTVGAARVHGEQVPEP
jgi:hypothetical protein